MSLRPVRLFLLLSIALPIMGMAQETDSYPRVPYRVGEELNFSVNWTVGNIGTAYMHVAAVDTFRANPCYRIEAGARSNKTIDLFYPVRDYFFSLIDTHQLFCRKSVKRQNEGKTRRHRELVYDQEAGIRYDLASGDTVDIVPEAQDELSIFYYFRTLDLDVGQGILLENFVDGDKNPLKVAVHRTEWVEVPAGRFFCYVVEPYLKKGGLFKHQGNLLIYITSDENRIPVKVTSELDFGQIVVMLESFTLGTG